MKRKELLLSTLNGINQYIKDNDIRCPFIDLKLIEEIVTHQSLSIVDGFHKLEEEIKLEKLGKFLIKYGRKKALVDKYYGGDESKLKERVGDGIMPKARKLK